MFRTRSSRRVLAALGGAAMIAGAGTTAPALASQFHAVLSGSNVSPAGDPDGWGRFRFRVDGTLNTVCGDLEVRSLGQVTSAKLYRGAPGETGMAVMDIDLPGREDNDSDDCDTVGDTLADDIQANPGNYYVVVNTAEFPNGALRGQIGPGEGADG
jgi:hypothetical protein